MTDKLLKFFQATDTAQPLQTRKNKKNKNVAHE